MHTNDITLPDGRTAHVHYNSDWSGDVVVTFGEEPHEESAVMSASLLLGLLRDPGLLDIVQLTDHDVRPFPMVKPPNTIDSVPRSIPWWIAAIAHRQYVREFGDCQSLEQLAKRGGFHWSELGMLLAAGIKTEGGIR